MFNFLKKATLATCLSIISVSSFSSIGTEKFEVPEATVKSYAKDFSLSESEALRRLQVMSNYPLISQKIIDKFGENLVAGIFFKHEGEFNVVVRTTKKGQKSRDVLSFANSEFPDLNIEVIPNSPRNFRSIINIIENQAKVLDKKVSGFQTLGYDPSTDKIVISVYEPSMNKAEDFYQKYGLEKVSGMDTKILLLEKPISPAILLGGSKLSTTAHGPSVCTAGFSAFSGDGSTPGIITAYHCTYNETIRNFFLTDHQGVVHTLTLSPSRSSANHDMALYLAPKNTPIAALIQDGGGHISQIDTRGTRTSLTAGQSYVCHTGMTTGFSCGLVSVINQPLYSTGILSDGVTQVKICKTTNKLCNPTFISITSPSLKCQPGDSGGPVWRGFTGYGIVSSCNVYQQTQGAQAILYASSLDYAYELPAQFAIQAY